MPSLNERSRFKVAIIGLGAIGSYLVGLIARLPSVGALLLVDDDWYEDSNVPAQDILREHIGRPKAVAQSARAEDIRRDAEITAFRSRVEDVPLGILREADVVLTALDSRRARQYVAQWCWRLGTPLIDSGVMADGLLARVVAYIPSDDGPCLECGWGTDDYELLSRVYACTGKPIVEATNSPAYLAAAAASLQTAECERLLLMGVEGLREGRQVLLDMSNSKVLTTDYVRNPECRFDHRIWDSIETVSGTLDSALTDVVDAMARQASMPRPLTFGVSGKSFLNALWCAKCQRWRYAFRISGRLTASEAVCECGEGLRAPGFAKRQWVKTDEWHPDAWRKTLSELGFHRGDIVTLVSGSSEKHFEILS